MLKLAYFASIYMNMFKFSITGVIKTSHIILASFCLCYLTGASSLTGGLSDAAI